jgi:flagellar protein FlaG
MDVGKVSATSVVTGSVPSLRKEPGLSSFPSEPKKAEPAQSDKDVRVELDNALADLQSRVQNVQRDLDFSVDDSTGDVVVKVVDRESGKVVRQFPSEEVLKLTEQLEDMQSLMFEAKA